MNGWTKSTVLVQSLPQLLYFSLSSFLLDVFDTVFKKRVEWKRKKEKAGREIIRRERERCWWAMFMNIVDGKLIMIWCEKKPSFSPSFSFIEEKNETKSCPNFLWVMTMLKRERASESNFLETWNWRWERERVMRDHLREREKENWSEWEGGITLVWM